MVHRDSIDVDMPAFEGSQFSEDLISIDLDVCIQLVFEFQLLLNCFQRSAVLYVQVLTVLHCIELGLHLVDALLLEDSLIL